MTAKKRRRFTPEYKVDVKLGDLPPSGAPGPTDQGPAKIPAPLLDRIPGRQPQDAWLCLVNIRLRYYLLIL
jgi:hypothetical protein